MTANFPPYTYVPGKFPHPHSDPRGHRFGADVETLETPLDPDWPRSLYYRLAVELFNHGYYWESHEFWEALWHAAGCRGIEATFFKALIQLAVVGVKIREGRTDGAITHAHRAAELLIRVHGEYGTETLAGNSLRDLIAYAESLCGAIPAIESNDQAVQIVFSFRLT